MKRTKQSKHAVSTCHSGKWGNKNVETRQLNIWISSYNLDSTSLCIMGSKLCGYIIYFSRRLVWELVRELVWETHWIVKQIMWITFLYKSAHVDTITCHVERCTTLPDTTQVTCSIRTRSLWITQDQDRCLYSRVPIIWINWDMGSMINQTVQLIKHVRKYYHQIL